MSEMRELSFAWTATENYKHYPPYVNLTGNRLAVRGEELFNGKYYEQGPYVDVELPPEAIAELRHTLSISDQEVEKVARALLAHDELHDELFCLTGEPERVASDFARAAILAIRQEVEEVPYCGIVVVPEGD